MHLVNIAVTFHLRLHFQLLTVT